MNYEENPDEVHRIAAVCDRERTEAGHALFVRLCAACTDETVATVAIAIATMMAHAPELVEAVARIRESMPFVRTSDYREAMAKREGMS